MEWWEFIIVLAVFLPLMALWVACLIDAIGRPDLGGVSKALWVLAILFFPLVGSLVYILTRPPLVRAPLGASDAVWGTTADTVPTTAANPEPGMTYRT